MSWINTSTKKSYNFKPPVANIGSTVNEVPFPMVQIQEEVANAAEIDVTVNVQTSVVPLEELAAATTINLLPATDLEAGAIVVLHVPCGATPRNLTLGDNCEAGTVTGVASTTKKAVLIYDGTTFVPTGVAFD